MFDDNLFILWTTDNKSPKFRFFFIWKLDRLVKITIIFINNTILIFYFFFRKSSEINTVFDGISQIFCVLLFYIILGWQYFSKTSKLIWENVATLTISYLLSL